MYPWFRTAAETQFETVGPPNIPLYGDHLLTVIVFGIVDMPGRDELDSQAGRIGWANIATCDITYTFSVDGTPREEWTVRATVRYYKGGECTVSQTKPLVNYNFHDSAEVGHLRRFRTWWKRSICEMKGCSEQ